MKTELVWQERIPSKDNFRACVFDMTFRPDGLQLLVAVRAAACARSLESD